MSTALTKPQMDLPGVPAPERDNPMRLLQLAIERGADINTIERIAALAEKVEAKDAEIAFNAAMTRAQSEMGPVGADMTNPQTKSRYASYAALDNKIRPLYTKFGFAISYNTGASPQADHLKVIAKVRHAAGHSETYEVDMPNDGKGAKGGDVMTKTHATGAAMSYGMRYLLKFIFNIAVGEDDKDGNAVVMNEQAIEDYCEAIRMSRDMAELQKAFSESWTAAKRCSDKAAMQHFMTAKDQRKSELQESQI